MGTDFSTGAERGASGAMRRRELLTSGLLGGLGALLPAVPAAAAPHRPRARHCILLFMSGGPSQIDTWDPKPEAPAEIRGEFRAIPTSVPGIRISEHLPLMARMANHLSILRSVSGSETSHERACYEMLTGCRMQRGVEHAAYAGALVQTAAASGDPAFAAAIPGIRRWVENQAPAGRSPLETGDPSREGYLQDLDAGRLALLETPVRRALDLRLEPQAVRERYGRSTIGQGALLARRLVESGVRFVTVTQSGWDTHGGNFRQLAERQLPELDRAMSALLLDLHQTGLLAETLVIWMGEFGRTPRINAHAGRDHWPHAQSVVLAGGGLPGGAVIGQTDAAGAEPVDHPITPRDLAATIHTALGLRGAPPVPDPAGRSLHLAEGGRPLRELLA